MNQNSKLWVEALRSGEYRQCQNLLSDGTGFCCLGVLCEVAIASGVEVEKIDAAGGIAYGGEVEALPRAVQDWAGLLHSAGNFGEGDRQLTVWNDRLGKTFLEIADIIESEPEGLFLPEQKESL